MTCMSELLGVREKVIKVTVKRMLTLYNGASRYWWRVARCISQVCRTMNNSRVGFVGWSCEK